jgi:hypothetical protein
MSPRGVNSHFRNLTTNKASQQISRVRNFHAQTQKAQRHETSTQHREAPIISTPRVLAQTKLLEVSGDIQ